MTQHSCTPAEHALIGYRDAEATEPFHLWPPDAEPVVAPEDMEFYRREHPLVVAQLEQEARAAERAALREQVRSMTTVALAALAAAIKERT